jgi:hypothetical protein
MISGDNSRQEKFKDDQKRPGLIKTGAFFCPFGSSWM